MRYSIMTIAAITWISLPYAEVSIAQQESITVRYPHILVIGTKAYEKKAKSLRVSPEKARMAAREHVRTHGGGDFGGANYHFVIIDNDYHFAPMYGKDSLILYGYFVHGNTGKVSKGRVYPFWLPFESNPDIRRAVQMTVAAKDRDSR